MKIKTIELKAFKRFTDLKIVDIPDTTKMIIVAGPNGCGKSSLFDGLYAWHRNAWKGTGHVWDVTYHVKQAISSNIDYSQAVKVVFYDPQPVTVDERRKAIYVRSAYRNDPEFQLSRLTKTESALMEERFSRLIDNDATVSKNYQRLASQGLEDIFEKEDESVTIGEFREKVIGKIRDTMERIFPGLRLNSLGNPLMDGTFKFDKGVSKAFLYKNLSGGEKAAFDLVLDLIVKSREYDNTVFCIDEPEAHMNTRLQGVLLEELFRFVPDNSQLWLTTHSIGMMRKARDLAQTNPGTIVFIDFDEKNFDLPTVITPVKPTRVFWQRVLNVAIDDLSELIAPRQVVICEGSPLGSRGRNVALDAYCYDKIFADEFPETKFLSAGSSIEVESDRLALLEAIKALLTGSKVIRLIDRDDHSNEDVLDKKRNGIRVLSRRHLECYLYDDEVIAALCKSVGQEEKISEILDLKAIAIDKVVSQGRPRDDIKSASGEIYNILKRTLNLSGVGNDSKAFMRSTLAPLIKSEMNVYVELRADIFEQ